MNNAKCKHNKFAIDDAIQYVESISADYNDVTIEENSHALRLFGYINPVGNLMEM